MRVMVRGCGPVDRGEYRVGSEMSALRRSRYLLPGRRIKRGDPIGPR